MFTRIWNKYLPVIRILLKRSVNGDQTLDMDKSDFQRAAGGKKVKLSFSLSLANGRQKGWEKISPVAADLLAALQQDDATRHFLRDQELEISMNNNWQLLIRNVSPPASAPVELAEEGEGTGEEKPENK